MILVYARYVLWVIRDEVLFKFATQELGNKVLLSSFLEGLHITLYL